VLKRRFGLKRDEMIGGWRELHNKKLHELYYSQDIIRMITSSRRRLAGEVEPKDCVQGFGRKA
jgi:hypothetical protein